MYYNGQIVYNLDTKRPVQVGSPGDGTWAWTIGTPRTTHFIENTGWKNGHNTVGIYFPQSITEAQDLLDKGWIQPAPSDKDRCWSCRNWWSNHNKDGSCWERLDKPKKV